MSDIEWVDPPFSPRSGLDGKGRIAAFVEQLRLHPDMWAKYPISTSTGSAAARYKRMYPGTVWTSRSRPDGRADLYARWVGEQ